MTTATSDQLDIFLAKPYQDRQLVTFVDRKVWEADKQVEVKPNNPVSDYLKIIARMLYPMHTIVTEAVLAALRAYQESNRLGLAV